MHKRLIMHKCPGCSKKLKDNNRLCMACYERTPEGRKVAEGFAKIVKLMNDRTYA